VQTPWIDVPEIDTLCDGFRSLNDQNYDQSLLEALQKPREEKKSEELEPVYIEALRYAVLEGKISISAIQRKCVISFNKAGRIIDWMEENGYITPFDKMTPAPRKVLLTKEKFIEKYGDL
jgi:DNA segregation ATPase FtsK/SpoIIIE-like protein